ncbi:MAG: TonB-dependent receptor [Pseudomonadota bacterium]
MIRQTQVRIESARSRSSRAERAAADVPEELVVRGEKFDRTLQDTISSVAVLEGETVDASYLTDISQILQRVPNVTDAGALAIRGIPERGVGSGTGDTAQTSAIYVDGAVQSQIGGSSGLTNTWDVEQVEVFRGAQTTTQGRAALGGAIVVNTVDPSFEWTGRARLAAGEFEATQAAIAFGGPVIDDRLAFRIAADSLRSSGFTEFETASGVVLDDIGESERDLLRAKLLWRFGADTEAVLSIADSRSTEGVNVVNGPDLFARRATEVINVNDTDVSSYALNVTHRLSAALSLTSVTSYTDLTLAVAPIAATQAGRGTSTVLDANDETFTQEFRLNYDGGGAVRAIVGAYYNSFDELSQRTISGTIPDFGVTLRRSDGYDNRFTNYALFGEGEFRLSDRWSLTVGARYDVEDSNRRENATTIVDPPLPFLPSGSSELDGDSEFDAFLPKLGVTYQFTDNLSLSAIYQRAYRPGGADIRPDTDEPIEFDPEYTDNYELAFRGLFLDGALAVNANAFYVDYTDMQIRFAPDPLVIVNRFIANAGEAKLYGLEVESFWRPAASLSLYGSVGLAASEFGEFLFQGGNFEGNEFPNQPGFNASFGGTYRLWNRLALTVDNIYSADFFSNVQNEPGQEVDGYFITNVRVGYERPRWGAYLYGQNIFDEDYLLSVGGNTPGSTFVSGLLGQPQSFGVVLEASF